MVQAGLVVLFRSGMFRSARPLADAVDLFHVTRVSASHEYSFTHTQTVPRTRRSCADPGPRGSSPRREGGLDADLGQRRPRRLPGPPHRPLGRPQGLGLAERPDTGRGPRGGDPEGRVPKTGRLLRQHTEGVPQRHRHLSGGRVRPGRHGGLLPHGGDRLESRLVDREHRGRRGPGARGRSPALHRRG